MQRIENITNPVAPATPKNWADRHQELLTTLFLDVRNLALLGYKKIAQDGTLTQEPLVTFQESISLQRPLLLNMILEHEVKLGWVLPPESGAGLPNPQLGGSILSAPENVSIVQSEPVAQPQPPPVVGRRRRSAGTAVAPPAPPSVISSMIAIVDQPVIQKEEPVMSTAGLPQFGVPTFGNAPIATGNDAVVLDRIDKIGKMVADTANNAEATYKAMTQALVKLDDVLKREVILMTAAHHMYVSTQALIAQMQSQNVSPPKDLTEFVKLMSYYAGIP